MRIMLGARGRPQAYAKGAWSVYGDPGNLDPNLIANTGVVGLLIGLNWNAIESAPQTYDWSALDNMVTQASDAGFAISIDVVASFLYTPQWIIDATDPGNIISLIDPAPNHSTFCQYYPVCLPWTDPFKQARKDLCAATASRYGNNPAVQGYGISYANHHSLDWNIPDGVYTPPNTLDCGTCPKPPPRQCGPITQDQPAVWVAAGWTESTFVNLGKEIFDHAASCWTRQRLKCPIGGMSDPRMATNYSSPAKAIMDYVFGDPDTLGNGKPYASRVSLQRQIFLTSWQDGTFYLANVPGQNSPNYIRYMMALRARPANYGGPQGPGPFPGVAGMQDQWGASAGPPQCLLQGGPGGVCGATCDPVCVMNATFNKALTYNTDSLEIIHGDGINPLQGMRDACTSYTLAVGGTPRT